MGASLNNFSVLSAVTTLLGPPQAASLAVRYASKKTGGSSKNLGGKSPGKRFGLKKMEGEGVPGLPPPPPPSRAVPRIPLQNRKATHSWSPARSWPEHLAPDYRCREDLRQGGGPEEEQISMNLGHVTGERRLVEGVPGRLVSSRVGIGLIWAQASRWAGGTGARRARACVCSQH